MFFGPIEIVWSFSCFTLSSLWLRRDRFLWQNKVEQNRFEVESSLKLIENTACSVAYFGLLHTWEPRVEANETYITFRVSYCYKCYCFIYLFIYTLFFSSGFEWGWLSTINLGLNQFDGLQLIWIRNNRFENKTRKRKKLDTFSFTKTNNKKYI